MSNETLEKKIKCEMTGRKETTNYNSLNTPIEKSETTYYELVRYRSDGFPGDILNIEYIKTDAKIPYYGETKKSPRIVQTNIVKIFDHRIVNSWSGNYDTHFEYGYIEVGTYKDGETVKYLEERLFDLIKCSKLPDPVKRAMGIEEKTKKVRT